MSAPVEVLAVDCNAWPIGEYRLWDSQWVNIVNHAKCYAGMDKSEAVALAVKLTEKAMRENIEREALAIAELIESDKELDAAYAEFPGLRSERHSIEQAAMRINVAIARRTAALARVKGETK